LNTKSTASQSFQWEQAKAADGSLLLYEVAFDQVGGDFSKPFYMVVSDGKGIQNTLTLSQSDLNKIAALGGAAFYERKKFKWAVFSSKGTNRVKGKTSRVIDLERPAGFPNPPDVLYLTGSATEGGTDINNALQLKRNGDVFEIYTKLSAGTYQFVDGKTGAAKKYYLADDNGILADGSTVVSGASKVMHIEFDINSITGKLTEIKSIQLWYCDAGAFWFTLPYTSNGVWRYDGYKVVLDAVPWGREERYKYKMVINDGSGGDKDLWLNFSNSDSPGQDGQYPHTPAYKTVNFTNNGSQWDFAWKFDKTYLTDNSITDFWVSLRATDSVYTQNYKKE
jgi:hypothetical protein